MKPFSFTRFKYRVKRAILVAGLTAASALPTVAAETSTSTLDLSGIMTLVMSILPLIIVIVVVKAILDAFGKLV